MFLATGDNTLSPSTKRALSAGRGVRTPCTPSGSAYEGAPAYWLSSVVELGDRRLWMSGRGRGSRPHKLPPPY
jgi:hypothetical protein